MMTARRAREVTIAGDNDVMRKALSLTTFPSFGALHRFMVSYSGKGKNMSKEKLLLLTG